MKRQAPSLKNRIFLVLSEAQLAHLRSTIPPRSRNAKIRQVLIEAGVIPPAEPSNGKTPTAA